MSAFDSGCGELSAGAGVGLAAMATAAAGGATASVVTAVVAATGPTKASAGATGPATGDASTAGAASAALRTWPGATVFPCVSSATATPAHATDRGALRRAAAAKAATRATDLVVRVV